MKQEIQSKEELYFEWFLQELQDNGYIINFAKANTYQLLPLVKISYEEILKTKTKIKEQTISREHNYTPDYEIHWNKKAENIFYQDFEFSYTGGVLQNKINTDLFLKVKSFSSNICLVEIKGGFSLHGQLRNNSIDRKLMLDNKQLFVNLVKIPDLFKLMFVPEKYLLTDTGKQNRIIHFKTKTLTEYINGN